jgi:hypothetical protein
MMVIGPEKADGLIQIIQVCTREALFYRSGYPDLIGGVPARKAPALRLIKHVVEETVHGMPGVSDRDGSLNFSQDMLTGRSSR